MSHVAGTNERIAWLPLFIAQLKKENVLLLDEAAQTLAPAQILAVDVEDWGVIAREAARIGLRWCAVWAEDRGEIFLVSAGFEKQGGYLIVRTELSVKTPVLPSHTPYYIGADRPERHLQDMFGLIFTDHPDARHWTRHMAWGDGDYPLRKNFPVTGQPQHITPPNNEYRFLEAQGPGVYEIPVGPVHAGIIEPGHFRFQAVGETVLNLEAHLGYAHKGIEKIAEGRDPVGLARLAGRVSGDTTVAHAWAACMAMERAAAIEPPPRAILLRAVMAECERIVNHLWDIAMVCNDVAYAFAFYQFSRVREHWLRLHAEIFGHRLLMDRIVPGGVAVDLSLLAMSKLRALCAAVRCELDELMPILDDNASLQDRLLASGELAPVLAERFGTVGLVGKASGLAFDVRHDAAYAPYDKLDVVVPTYTAGDVDARVKVRIDEIRISSCLIEQLLEHMIEGAIVTQWRAPAADAEGLGMVDGWRGEIITFVRFAAGNRIARYFPRDPSWTTWPALEKLIRGNIVPDFPVCNKSVNGSYSGHDL